jgi:hypothetical protein
MDAHNDSADGSSAGGRELDPDKPFAGLQEQLPDGCVIPPVDAKPPVLSSDGVVNLGGLMGDFVRNSSPVSAVDAVPGGLVRMATVVPTKLPDGFPAMNIEFYRLTMHEVVHWKTPPPLNLHTLVQTTEGQTRVVAPLEYIVAFLECVRKDRGCDHATVVTCKSGGPEDAGNQEATGDGDDVDVDAAGPDDATLDTGDDVEVDVEVDGVAVMVFYM